MKSLALIAAILLVGCKDKITETQIETVTAPGLCTNPPTAPALKPTPIEFSGIQSITDITNNSVTINWTNVDDISAYQVALLDDSQGDIAQGTTIVKTISAPANQVVINNLKPDTEYTFFVRAIDTNGLVSLSYKNLKVRTKLLPPYSNKMAINFSGSQSLALKESKEYFKTGKITASLWFRTTENPSNDTRLISFHKGANASTALSLGVRDNKVYLRYSTARGSLKYVALNINYANNHWNHLAVTHNTRFLTLYYNGQEVFNLETDLSTFGNHKAHIGAFTGIQRGFYGAIDEVAIYDSALSSSNIENIYNNGISQDLREHERASSLLSWFRMGDDTQDNTDQIIDQSQGWNALPIGLRSQDFITK